MEPRYGYGANFGSHIYHNFIQVSKPGPTGAVYRGNVNWALRIFPVYPGQPATNYRDAPGHTPGQCEAGLNYLAFTYIE
jgi:hypothetical protein